MNGLQTKRQISRFVFYDGSFGYYMKARSIFEMAHVSLFEETKQPVIVIMLLYSRYEFFSLWSLESSKETSIRKYIDRIKF